jgi:hypothetical protein
MARDSGLVLGNTLTGRDWPLTVPIAGIVVGDALASTDSRTVILGSASPRAVLHERRPRVDLQLAPGHRRRRGGRARVPLTAEPYVLSGLADLAA